MHHPAHCAYCKKPISGEVQYSIHRDGFDDGPEVPLCEACGAHPTPTCSEIWKRISETQLVPASLLN